MFRDDGHIHLSTQSGRSKWLQRSGPWRDVLALARSVELAGAVPMIRRRAARYVAEYKQVVAPIVESTLGPSGPREYLGDSMCETCAEVSFLLAGYSATANVPFRPDLAVLGIAITRVYDDLIDEYGDDDLVQRISVLFGGGVFSPANPVERLFLALYLELEERLGRNRSDPFYSMLAILHEAQVRSRRQRDPAIQMSELAEIIRDKGGYATAVLFALMRPGMDDRELALVAELGEALQLVDDYLDVEADLRAGISTTATRGGLSLADICRRVCDLRPALRDYYGRDQPLCGVVYLNLWICFIRRRLPKLLGASTRLVAVSVARRDERTPLEPLRGSRV